jgi:hypothetical protein
MGGGVRVLAVSIEFLQARGGAMAETPSKTQILLARLVIVLIIVFTAVGVFWYGLSEEVRHRVWEQLIARPTGPMAFRFILQPIMAAIAALRDGVNDARSGRPPISGHCSPIRWRTVIAYTKD